MYCYKVNAIKLTLFLHYPAYFHLIQVTGTLYAIIANWFIINANGIFELGKQTFFTLHEHFRGLSTICGFFYSAYMDKKSYFCA